MGMVMGMGNGMRVVFFISQYYCNGKNINYGDGRCGTTFLVKLFTFLNFDTGYTRHNYHQSIFANCNSGMEKEYTDKHYILKNPHFITKMEQIVNDPAVKVKTVIIPIRNLHLAAASRVRNKNLPGGLWNSTNHGTQVEYYKKILHDYNEVMTQYNVPTIFLDFHQMTQDKEYLFNMLKSILDEKNTDFDTFSRVYDEVAVTSQPGWLPPPPPPPSPRPTPKLPIKKFNKRLQWV